MSNYPKLSKMVVRNFRAISEDVHIELNDIVVLVGSNNSGKSTLLKAYEKAVNSEKFTLDDFSDRCITNDKLPEVEIHTIVDDDTAPKKEIWCEDLENGTYLVKEKWTWKDLKSKPDRVGYKVKDGKWAESSDKPHMPWATDNVALSKRPKPHRVSTFDSPETQSDAIKDIVVALLEEEIKTFKPKKEEDEGFSSLIGKFETLKKEFTDASKEKVKEISDDVTKIVSRIIPNHEFSFSIEEALSDDPFQIFSPNDVEISFGEGEKLFPIINHGSGARRTILWAVLKKLAEMGYEAKAGKKKFEKITSQVQSHILLMDEPEISLHPKAIREACGVLYGLPNNDLWQVMITTHSPNFIDLTRDHTTIVRVEKSGDDAINATTLYKADKMEFTDDEKQNLKLLNLIDPHVLEFFFGGRVLLVEGDTEYNAFNHIKNEEQAAGNDAFSDLLIIRARGKVTIASLMKILNHFKKQYYVLHDTDNKTTIRRNTKKGADGKKYIETREIKNPAWTNNEKILSNMSTYSSVFACLINFEVANFGESLSSGKPAKAMEKIKEKSNYQNIKSLLSDILKGEVNNENFIRWTSMDELDTFITSYESLEEK